VSDTRTARAEAAISRDQAYFSADTEHQPGLPEPLPDGERVLWSGAPDWRLLSVHVFHVRPLASAAVLFAMLSTVVALAHRAPAAYATLAFVTPLLAGVAAAALAGFAAWLTAHVSLYTVTSRRVVLRVGLLLPVNLNIPFAEITDVALRAYGNGAGDLPLAVRSHQRVSYLLLWPHVKPMTFRRVQPMLRAVRDGEAAAAALVQALRQAHAERPVAANDPVPVDGVASDPVVSSQTSAALIAAE
jgi:hypothetical protein